MSLLDYVMTSDEMQEHLAEAQAASQERNRLFSLVENDVRFLAEAFDKAEIESHDIAQLYKPTRFAKTPPKGWALAKRGDYIAYLTSTGLPLMVRVTNSRLKGYEPTTFARIARFLLPAETAIDNDVAPVKMKAVGKDAVSLAFSRSTVSEDLAHMVNNYQKNTHKSFRLSIN